MITMSTPKKKTPKKKAAAAKPRQKGHTVRKDKCIAALTESADKAGFVSGWRTIAANVHANARAKGFWDKERNDGEALALIHSEVSEALEALREGNPPSEKAPGFSCVEEECADVLIRIMDLAAGRGWDVAGALLAKVEHNAGRPPMHGKEF
jgi:NTP pyrophosphatase (non-canonical NTP hydrolase)